MLDGGSQSEPLAASCRQWLGIEVIIVKRSNSAAGFSVLPNREVVERTFAWFGLGKYRHLNKGYEALSETSDTDSG